MPIGVSAGRQLHKVESKAEARVAGLWSVRDVLARVLDGADAAVADIPDERRLVEQLEHERRIRFRQLPQRKPGRG